MLYIILTLATSLALLFDNNNEMFSIVNPRERAVYRSCFTKEYKEKGIGLCVSFFENISTLMSSFFLAFFTCSSFLVL